MNEDAFARRFYADRSELESLRIQLTVERPADGAAEQENYSLRPENFHLPPIAFTDKELAALQTALSLLDGEFAYAEPLRLALQQITWGRPSPLRAPEQRSVALGITASAGGHELSARLAKVETAIFRNKTIVFDYYTMERDEVSTRKVDPYHLLFQGGAVLPAGLLARAQGDPRLPAVADPRQGRLRDQGRARLPPARGLRPARLRQPRRLAARRAAGRRADPRLRADRVADRTPLRPLRRDLRPGRAGGRGGCAARGRPGRGWRHRLPDRLLGLAQPDLVGARARRQRAPARAARAGRRAVPAARSSCASATSEEPPVSRRKRTRGRGGARLRAAVAGAPARVTARGARRRRSAPSASRGW